MKKGQTATEYLVILAVVILIALVVVNILSSTTSVSSTLSSNVDLVSAFDSDKIQLHSLQIGTYYASVELKNTFQNKIQVTQISLDEQDCINANFPFLISTGASKLITCFGSYSSDQTYTTGVHVTLIDDITGAEYVVNASKDITIGVATNQETKNVYLAENEYHYITLTTNEHITLLDLMINYSLDPYPGLQIHGFPNCTTGQSATRVAVSDGTTWFGTIGWSGLMDSINVTRHLAIKTSGTTPSSINTGNQVKYWQSDTSSSFRPDNWCEY